LLALAALCGSTVVPNAAQASAPAAPGAAAQASQYCPLHVRVYALKDAADELAFTLWSDDAAGAASGNITAYVNGGRYTIPFTDVVAVDERDAKALPKPIVVKFDGPARFESAYVGTLEGGDCDVHAPFVRKPLATIGLAEDTKISIFPDRSREWPAFLAQAATVTPIPAPAPVSEEQPACAKPYVPASTTQYVPPIYPNGINEFFAGDIVIKLALGEDGKITAMRMDKSSRDKAYDRAAALSVAQSKFAAEIYRCKPVTTDLYFDVKFRTDENTTPNNDFRQPTGGLMGQGKHDVPPPGSH
jgi:hypothetical protein